MLNKNPLKLLKSPPFLSLIAHAAVLAVAVFFFQDLQVTEIRPPLFSEPFEVALEPPAPKPAAAQTSSSTPKTSTVPPRDVPKSQGAQPGPGKPKYILRPLGIGFGPTVGFGTIQMQPSVGAIDGYAVAGTMTLEQEAELLPFLQALWKKIDQGVGYPDDFTKRRIIGPVTVQFHVNDLGRLTRFIRVDSPEPLLKAYTMAALVHALREELPDRLRAPTPSVIIVTKFNFETFGHGENPARAEAPVTFKNVLEFRRSAYVEPKVNEAINRVITRWIPPIIIVPGGFYIDFVRAYEFVENLSKPDPEDIRNSRMELSREAWEEIIREKEDKR